MKKIAFLLLIIVSFSACKKEEYIKTSITFSDVEVTMYSELIAIIKYNVIVEGSPLVRESGTIVTVDPEVSYFNFKVVNDEKLLKNVSINLGVDAETQFFVRPYVITYEDTLYGEIQSFMSGSYYKVGNGVIDASGNNYETIILGNQEWMVENLKTFKYCNGDSIPLSNDITQFLDRNDEPQSLYYDFDINNYDTYGLLYNGYAIFDQRNICPCGWRVPTDYDWSELIIYLGNNKYTGSKMKTTGTLEEGTGLWKQPNGFANNLSGFSALPGGYQEYGPSYFYGKNTYAVFPYINTQGTESFLQMLSIDYVRGSIEILGNSNDRGMYTRCVKNL
ncbi:hypothetical protein ERX46_04060 [Brumimicrobium glaciale]|uniref:Fibrobacter succinogenes major paralogous domain-containing protein n=1 Tax=Brumimicrobium glaciale TaxID=200475 RepID=A0A4V1WFV9_9FLAO|nr:fibrobacter succinogenes major paralogous domain-containing protein [Brumimicrobium glaciale]RYM34556.1 hypothetical protein ERX46_04060 [Brumimicrobium glaciale]